jgi:hypothetical protein
MKVFIIESPNPNDLLESRNEKSSLENMCKMFGHQSTSFSTYSKDDLDKIVKYIAKVDLQESDILCLHFSCHGDSAGIEIGSDFIQWGEFIQVLLPIFADKEIGSRTFIIISACGANEQTITRIINLFDDKLKAQLSPPYYFFVYNQDTVEWRDSLICWAILYHQLGKLESIKKQDVKQVLDRIKNAKLGDIKYYRWDSAKLKYLKYPFSK